MKKPKKCVVCGEKTKAVVVFSIFNNSGSQIGTEFACLKCVFDLEDIRKSIIQKSTFQLYQLLNYKDLKKVRWDDELTNLDTLRKGQFKIEWQ